MLKNYLLIFLISMVPIIELRGAIPIGLGMGLPVLPTYLLCVLGNMIPVPFIYLFARKFLIWGYYKPLIGPICRFCINKGEKGGRALEAKAGKGCSGTAAVRGHPAAGHRCVDGHAGSLHSGYEVQGRADRLHGRCAAGGHHHGLGKRRAAGRAQRAVCGRLTKRGRFCREKCR